MLNNIKSKFSIKDLENLSGIKAHTIRIWEKRYNILTPKRTETNIRYYDVDSLRKLLNITLLHRHGYKISKISTFPEDKIPTLVSEIVSRKSAGHHAINAFKVAMMNFDPAMFHQTYNVLLSEKSFREIFNEVVIPLMEDVGILWQSGTITPAHEHFITNLIAQKVMINLEKVQATSGITKDRVFVLFLPMNELHELGLMYVNYEVALHGYRSVYLGESVPMENLREVKNLFDDIVFVSSFTVEPTHSEMQDYVERLCDEIVTKDSQLWLLGRMMKDANTKRFPSCVKVFDTIGELVDEL